MASTIAYSVSAKPTFAPCHLLKRASVSGNRISNRIRASSESEPTKIVQNIEPKRHALKLSLAASSIAVQTFLASEQPANAFEFPAIWVLTPDEVGSLAVLLGYGAAYLLIAPPIIFNYLRLRWFDRSTPETIFQYLLFFLFFPAMLLWSPFINFRRFPRDKSEL